MSGPDWLDLILQRAADLRAAGILTVSADGCSATISPTPPVVASESKRTPAQKLSDTDDNGPATFWDDAASYPNGVVPGFKIERLERPGEED